MSTTNGSTNGNGHADESNYTVPLWIDGKEVTTNKTFNVVSPVNSKTIWKAYGASVKEAGDAVQAAQRAFKTWRKTPPSEIRDIFIKAADIMQSRYDELARYMEEETGAPSAVSGGSNLVATIEMLRFVSGLTATSTQGTTTQSKIPGRSAIIFKEPFGVIFGIAPWNAPYILGMRAALFAIASGNTTVLKGPELAPRCYWGIGSVLHEAGLPAGVLNVLFHDPADAVAVTNFLIEAPEVKKVNYTGSTAVGAIIAAKAGKELKPVLMELGGKASAIVCADANLQTAAFQCALGALVHAGQICMSTERVLVDKSILGPFSEALKGAIGKIYPDSKDAPILVAKAAVDKNRKLIKDATSKGAELLYGDVEHIDENKYRLKPFVVTGINKEMDIYYTESFGPSMSLIPFENEEEAIAIANDTEYGLSGAVFTTNLGTGLRIAKEVDSGAIHINSMTVHDEPQLPHGGVKKSGWGRFNAQWGMEEFLKLKTVTYDL